MDTAIPKWPLSKQDIRKLGQKKYRQRFGYYFLEGSIGIRDALESSETIQAILFTATAEKRSFDSEVLKKIRQHSIPLVEIGEADARTISGLSTSPGLFALLPIPDELSHIDTVQPGITLALDQINDPGNVGTLLRAAAFYGVSEVWLGKGTAELYNPKTLRAAMGTHFHVPVISGVDMIETLSAIKDDDCTVLVTNVEQGAPPKHQQMYSSSVILVLGSEAHGVSAQLKEAADEFVFIPRSGPVDSLNVAMAGTVLLDRLTRK